MKFITVLFCVLCFLGNSSNSHAQILKRDSTKRQVVERNLEIWGTLLKDREPLEDALITVKINDRIVKDTVRSDAKGMFAVKLEFGYTYIISFSKENYVSKKIEVVTSNIPEEDKNTGYETGGFEVELFRLLPNVDYSIYDQIIGRISYDPKYRQFTYDRKFIKKQSAKIKEFEVQLVEIQKEFEAEEQKLNSQYDLFIRDADIEFQSRDYELALEYYEEALKIKEDEEYPKRRINEIKNISAQKLRKLDDRYTEFIQVADSAYNKKDWEVARSNYVEALALKPEEKYPKDRIIELTRTIDELSNLYTDPVKSTEKVYSLKDVPIPREKERFSMELARKYPQGLTENEYVEGNKKIMQRIIVQGNKGVEYKRITHNWGGVYYFRNGEPISQFSWNKETY